jgi:hypothetical protein
MSLESIKAGLAAATKVFTSTSREYLINGRVLKCPVCEGGAFEHRRVLLSTTVAAMVNLDWTNANASAMICDECTHISWFYKEPERKL